MLSDFISLLKTSRSTQEFYHAINHVYKKYCGKHLMLHYPFYNGHKDDLLQAQKNLTDYCISRVLPVTNQTMLDVGCGNGIQSMYICSTYGPEKMIGIDLNEENIAIANTEKKQRSLNRISFYIANAQDINCVPDSSIDVVINIESAVHYIDKMKFLDEIHRVLKPGGRFVIADELTTCEKKKRYERRMMLHYWKLEQYLGAFEKSPLQIIAKEEITDHVVEGFRRHRYWFRDYCGKGVFWKIIIQLWAKCLVMWAVHLFRTIHTYYLFVGVKPTT
jgi:ubiquinone/menaquinone biosynthesis C-methylase UbiE